MPRPEHYLLPLTSTQDLTLDDSVKRITPAAVQNLATDTAFLSSFVEGLDNPILMENLDELMQTVALMGTENTDEFFDVAQRNRKYGKVDNMKGAILIEKYVPLLLPYYDWTILTLLQGYRRCGCCGTEPNKTRGRRSLRNAGFQVWYQIGLN